MVADTMAICRGWFGSMQLVILREFYHFKNVLFEILVIEAATKNHFATVPLPLESISGETVC